MVQVLLSDDFLKTRTGKLMYVGINMILDRYSICPYNFLKRDFYQMYQYYWGTTQLIQNHIKLYFLSFQGIVLVMTRALKKKAGKNSDGNIKNSGPPVQSNHLNPAVQQDESLSHLMTIWHYVCRQFMSYHNRAHYCHNHKTCFIFFIHSAYVALLLMVY